jgi:hypothetical protein
LKRFQLFILIVLSFSVFAPAVALTAQSAQASADSAFTISGIVHDTDGKRLSHAYVSVHGNDSKTSMETVTGDSGEFLVHAPRAGSYRVEIVAEGFAPLVTNAGLGESSPGSLPPSPST